MKKFKVYADTGTFYCDDQLFVENLQKEYGYVVENMLEDRTAIKQIHEDPQKLHELKESLTAIKVRLLFYSKEYFFNLCFGPQSITLIDIYTKGCNSNISYFYHCIPDPYKLQLLKGFKTLHKIEAERKAKFAPKENNNKETTLEEPHKIHPSHRTLFQKLSSCLQRVFSPKAHQHSEIPQSVIKPLACKTSKN